MFGVTLQRGRCACTTRLATGLLAASMSSSAIGATVFVDASTGNDANLGVSWATAVQTIQRAEQIADAGDSIFVANGVYLPGAASQGSSFEPLSLVRYFGNWPGSDQDTVDALDERNPLDGAQESILEGAIPDGANPPVHALHVVQAEGVSDVIYLDGFVIEGGRAVDSTAPVVDPDAGRGAGMWIKSSLVDLVMCQFRDNEAGVSDCDDSVVGQGGAIAVAAPTAGSLGAGEGIIAVRLMNCVLTNNEAHWNASGGAIFVSATASLQAINSVFVDNKATGDSCEINGTTQYNPAFGGAITAGGICLVQHCTMLNNAVVSDDPGLGVDALGRSAFVSLYGGLAFENSIGWQTGTLIGTDEVASDVSTAVALVTSTLKDGDYGSTTADPLFVNAPSDLRLQSSSPCIDTASSGVTVALEDDRDIDHDGQAFNNDGTIPGLHKYGEPVPDRDLAYRLIRCAPDQGAYEYSWGCDESDLKQGDVDRNYRVNFQDLLYILNAWGQIGGAEDVNGSGVVDFGDILVVLTDWGVCGSTDPSCSGEISQGSIQECINLYGTNPVQLEKCIESMFLNGTP